MEIGYFAVGIWPTVAPEWVRTVATTAERLGFSTIWAPEHVVLLDEYASNYPYSSGKFPGPTDTPIADPFTTLAYAAACTTKIRLATGICLVPEHNPLVLAKTVATVDQLSGGRFIFIFGVGVGWPAEEFEALGVPFERRGPRTREYVEVMRKLWTERSSSHQGEFVKFTNVLSYPKPVSENGVPVWFGGESNPALRRHRQRCRGSQTLSGPRRTVSTKLYNGQFRGSLPRSGRRSVCSTRRHVVCGPYWT